MSRHFAVIGAGLAGIACARTLVQGGQRATLFERTDHVGGRMAARHGPFGSFDAGAQYFTVRDARFRRALDTLPQVTQRWSANAVHVVDPLGHVVEASPPAGEPRWVAAPAMDRLPQAWVEPLAAAGALHLDAHVEAIEADALEPRKWQVRTSAADGGQHVASGFDGVLLAIPAAPAAVLLERSRLAPMFVQRLRQVTMAPCWTLLLAFPQATQALGPQWNAAFSRHHRIAWLARESSKPGRGPVERWTVQASADWSAEHFGDDPARVEAKLLKAFAELTGIRARPGQVQVERWTHAKTLQPLDRSHLWDARIRIGACGDWCLGHRVEHAFASGLDLALAALEG